MSPEELANELDAGQIRPAYLLVGEEALLRDDALHAIRQAVLAGGPEDFNSDRLESDATPAALHDAVRTLPVMASRRFVWLREPDLRRSAKLLEALADVAPTLDADSTSVLVVTCAKAARNLRWAKAFAKPRARVDCAAPKGDRALAGFVRREAERQGIALAGGAAELLAERIGPQLMQLRQELAKAALLAGPGTKVTRAHVAESACDLAEEPIWDLTDAIGEGRAGDALALLGRLLEHGAPPPVVLGSLAAHFRRLVRAREGAGLDGPPFVVRKLQSQSRRYRPARLLACLKAIHEVDEVLKGKGALGPRVALERLVLGLAA